MNTNKYYEMNSDNQNGLTLNLNSKSQDNNDVKLLLDEQPLISDRDMNDICPEGRKLPYFLLTQAL